MYPESIPSSCKARVKDDDKLNLWTIIGSPTFREPNPICCWTDRVMSQCLVISSEKTGVPEWPEDGSQPLMSWFYKCCGKNLPWNDFGAIGSHLHMDIVVGCNPETAASLWRVANPTTLSMWNPCKLSTAVVTVLQRSDELRISRETALNRSQTPQYPYSFRKDSHCHCTGPNLVAAPLNQLALIWDHHHHHPIFKDEWNSFSKTTNCQIPGVSSSLQLIFIRVPNGWTRQKIQNIFGIGLKLISILGTKNNNEQLLPLVISPEAITTGTSRWPMAMGVPQ